MSMGEPFPQSEPVKPKRKSKRRAAKPAPDQKLDELAGLTVAKCCDGCRAGHCVITENQFCGHPYKSSHPTAGPNIVARIERAKKRIAHQRIDAA